MNGTDKPAAAPAAGGLYGIHAHFEAGCSVLLTGASGYIGSLVLEKLLRSTNVGHVYVLLRARRGVAPADRVRKRFDGPLFHMVEESDMARVTAVSGDILEPGLGLSEEDEATLVANVDTVIHSAADIRLDAPIHDTLRANFRGSCAMTKLAMRMERLRSLVYVSTCYVNINRPKLSQVEERVYPLALGGKEVDPVGIAEELLAMPVEEAEALAAKYIDLWGFKNTYALGKHLAEKAVVGLQKEHGLPLVIVRPSLVSAVAAEPYAGYSGNFAGQVGGVAAYLVGLYNDNGVAAATNGESVWDVVPGDIVAHATIAAAAAAASLEARKFLMAPLRAADKRETGDYAVVQVGSSCTYPISFANMFNYGVVWCCAHRRPFTLALGRAKAMSPDQVYNEKVWTTHMRSVNNKVKTLVWILRRMGGKKRMRMARMIEAGMSTFETINTPKYDLQLFFQAGVLQRLEECMAPEDASEFRIVWRPPTNPLGPSPAAGSLAGKKAGKGGAGNVLLVNAVSVGSSIPAAEAAAAAAEAAAEAAGGGKEAGEWGYGLAPELMIQPGDDIATRKAKVAAIVAASKEGGWQLFLHNMVTFLWRTIYGKEIPIAKKLSPAKVRALLPYLSKEEAVAVGDLRHIYTCVA